MVNRRLIRPNLAELKDKMGPGGRGPAQGQQHGPHRGREGQPGPRRRAVPPEQTAAEAFYYLKQMNSRTPMVVVMSDGEQYRGHIEWYDKLCVKVHRPDGPNLLLFKHDIKLMYKLEEEDPDAAAGYSPE